MVRCFTTPSCQQGATLVELIMTIVIISVAIAGVVGAFSLMTGRSADPLNQSRAVALSQLYMDEIFAKKFAEGSPVGGGAVDSNGDADCSDPGDDGESRSTFNDVDDYHGLFDDPPRNSEEVTLGGYSGFTVSISVQCDGSQFGFSENYQAKRVDITIADPSGNNYVFSAYRGNF
ncbi:MAG: type II secretion system protein [Marinobacter sp.]|nr:type II secretion system protein [Marinobacter sp.]